MRGGGRPGSTEMGTTRINTITAHLNDPLIPEDCDYIPPERRSTVRCRLMAAKSVELTRLPPGCVRYRSAVRTRRRPLGLRFKTKPNKAREIKPTTWLGSWWQAVTRPGEPEAERVCNRCLAVIENVEKAETVIKFLLSNPYIDLTMWPVLKCLNRTYRAAIEYLETKWRRLGQRVLTLPDWRDGVAVKLLRQNAALTRGHPTWTIVAAVVAGTNVGASFGVEAEAGNGAGGGGGGRRTPWRRRSCTTVGCCSHTLQCSPDLTIANCFQIFRNLPSSHALHFRARLRMSRQLDKLEPFAPTLLWQALGSPEVLRDIVLPAAAASFSFCTSAYFYARSHPNLRHIKSCIFDQASPEVRKELAASEFFLTALLTLMRLDTAVSTRSATLDRHVLEPRPFVPGSTRFRVVSVDINSLARLDSYTKPWVVTCKLADMEEEDGGEEVEGGGEGGGRQKGGRECERVLMVKNEAVYKDDVVQRMQHYLLSIDPDLALTPYLVTPIAPTQGLILFLDNCRSLAAIQKEGNIATHLLANNQKKLIEDVQLAFMRSCAASAVLSLLCAFGDRHLNNILLRKDRLIHVDFGYLFGEEPPLSTHRLSLPAQSIRLTKNMLDVFRENHYQTFLDLCARINRLVRSVSPDLFFVAQALVPVNGATREQLETHFNHYMLPYTITNAREADRFIINVVENDALSTSSVTVANMFTALLEYLKR